MLGTHENISHSEALQKERKTTGVLKSMLNLLPHNVQQFYISIPDLKQKIRIELGVSVKSVDFGDNGVI